MPLDYLWKPHEAADKTTLQQFEKELPISEVFLSLLLQRNISNRSQAEVFFNPDLQKLHDPFLMKDMDKAVKRIVGAISAQEKIMVYGDYDVDGTTAVALFSAFLEKHHSQVITYIPDRYKEGYGVSQAGIDYAKEQNITLIVALDCGIKANEKVEYASLKGTDFIICDHHTPGPELPKAVAVLDPKRSDCHYPYKGLSGCGVGFKLVQALCKKWDLSDQHWLPYLDLLAVSIGADIVPMNGENRILTYYGLKKINQSPSPGIAALIKIAKPSGGNLDISDVVFMLAPRINAAGRLAHGKTAVSLLKGEDTSIVEKIAQEINQNNTERRSLDQSITQKAIRQIQDLAEENRKTSVVYEASWHKGVIGIVASRLIENYYRPTIVFTKSGDKLAGSARTVAGFDVYQALLKCEHILEQFGGHPAAAGMTLKAERYEEFKNHFEKVVAETISPEHLQPNITYDLKVKLDEISPNFYNTIQRFAPFGPENLSPIFRSDDLLNHESRAVGESQKHLKLSIMDPETGIVMDGIGFGMAHHLETLKSGTKVSILYHLEQNIFRNKVSLQLRLLDLKPSENVI